MTFLRRGSALLIVGMMMLSGLIAHVSMPMVVADETVTITLGSGETYTIAFDDLYMISTPGVLPADEDIVINSAVAGNRLIYLGEDELLLSFMLDCTADPTEDVTVAVQGTGVVSVGDDTGGQIVAGTWPGAQQIIFTIDTSNVGNVEQTYPLTVSITEETNGNSGTIGIDIYVSSLWHSDFSDYERDTKYLLPDIVDVANDFAFEAGSTFVQASLTTINHADFVIEQVNGTLMSGDSRITLLNNVSTVPPGAPPGVPLTLNWWIDIAARTPPGYYPGSIVYDYLRTVMGADKYITENTRQTQFPVDFSFRDEDPVPEGDPCSEYQCRNTCPNTVINGTGNRTINVTVENNGNTAIYNFAFCIWSMEWPGFQNPLFFWTENETTYYDVVTETFSFLDVGESLFLQIDVLLEPTISLGLHECYIWYDGFYYNDGSLGEPTGFFGLNGGDGDPNIADDLRISLEIMVEEGTPGELYLDEGWNLISLPLLAGDVSIPNALSSILGKWDYIIAYDASSPDPWKTNCTYKPDQLNDLEYLNNKMGFWINITEPGCSISFGPQPGVTQIPLYAGWNLVGYPTLTNTVTVGTAFWGTNADRVEICDTSEPYNIREVSPTYVMQPGEGYWVRVPADTVWVIDW